MRLFTIVLALLLSVICKGQITIEGKVVDEDKNPLIAATILIKNTEIGTISNETGNFSLEIDSLPTTLSVSYVGYPKQEILVKQEAFLNIKLKGLQLPGCGVVIISDSPIKITTPAPIMQLNPRQLQRDNDLAITPALNRVAGVYMHSGALNTNRLTIRGIGNRSLFSTTKIRAYLNDIPLTTGDGETTIEDIDLSIIDRVQVWKGPTASVYGAGLGGMIHLETNRQFRYHSNSSISSKVSLGSYGLLRNVSNISLTNRKQTAHFNINYNTTHSDGYRDNNEYNREGISVIGKLKADDKNTTTILANYTKIKAFIPSSLNRTNYEENPQKAAFTWGQVKGFEDYDKLLLGLSHRTQIKDWKYWTLSNTSSIFSSFRNNYESRPFNILDETSRSLGFRSNFEFDGLNYGRNFHPKVNVGVEVFDEAYKWQTFVTNEGVLGDNLSNNEEQRNYINLFVQSEIDWNKWKFLAGLNLNHTTYDYWDKFARDSIDLSGDYAFDWILSPRIGASYAFQTDKSLFASISHGFSLPSLEETLLPDGAINPNIQPEKGWNFELGTRGNIRNRLFYELTAYQMQIRDLLVAQRVGNDQFVGVNAGQTRHTGLEAFVEYFLLENPNRTSVFVSYTHQNYQFVDFIDEANDYSGNPLTGTAPHQLSAGIDFRLKQGFYGNLNYQFVDAFPMRDDNSIDSDAYQVTNLKMGYQKLFKDQFQLNIFAGIQNILDEKYASMILINAGSFGGNAPRYYYPAMPRNYFGGVEMKYYFKN